MTVRVYRSSDSSAPAATTAIGGLITLLDAVLVNGYGSKSPLGWTKSYSGTNLATYLQGSGSAGRSLRVDDTAVGAATVRGLVSPANISDITSGAFYHSSYNYFTKPDAQWMVVGNEKAFYLFVNRATWGLQRYSGHFFGDIQAFAAADVGRTLLIGDEGFSTVLPANWFLSTTTMNSQNYGHVFAGSEQSLASSATFNANKQRWEFAGATNLPSVSNGRRVLFSPVVVGASSTTDARGLLPGCHFFCHANDASLFLTPGQTIAGSGLYTGKTFEAVRMVSNTPEERTILIETSDTWAN